MDRRELKMGAKEAMRVAAISPYGVTIIYGIIMFIISGVQKALDDWGMILFQTGEYEDLSQLSSYVLISLGFFIIYFLFSSILDFGYQLLCLKFSNRDSSMSYSDLFIGIRYLFKVLGLYLMMFIFTVLWLFVFIVPGIIATYRYSQAVFILAENPEKGILQCIRESKEMMIGHKFEYFVLELSFILWFLLLFATFGLASIYVNPYVTVTKANYYNALKPKAAADYKYTAFT